MSIQEEKPGAGNSSEKADKLPTPEDPVKVTLADDDKDDQEIFGEALNETNIPNELTTVNSGAELMEHLKDESTPNPDIIFMDINMPVKNGKEVLSEIKADENLKDIPTVILSTSAHPKDVEEAFEAGANLYVPKPYSFANFILMLKKIFSLKWTGELLRPLRKTFFMSDKNLH
jgi:CheY-like chemotaxis protein